MNLCTKYVNITISVQLPTHIHVQASHTHAKYSVLYDPLILLRIKGFKLQKSYLRFLHHVRDLLLMLDDVKICK